MSGSRPVSPRNIRDNKSPILMRHNPNIPSSANTLTVPLQRTRRQSDSHYMDTTSPLLDTSPPTARPEEDDLDSDDRETVNAPYPGVDDGLFSTENPNAETPADLPANNHKGSAPGHPEEPRYPSYPDYGSDIADTLEPRAGFVPNSRGTEVEFGGMPDLESIPDVNVYQQKKTLAQGMMDLALFSANANQLRYVLESYDRHPYYYPSLAMITFSLLLQIAVGVGLIWNAHYNVKDEKEICIANRISNFTIIGIFLVTIINVFVSAFGVANAPASVPPT